LKTLEKINRKAIRNSLENRKANLAQVGPLSLAPRAPAPSCPRCLTGRSRLSVPTRAPSLSLSFSRCPVGQVYRCRSSRTRAASLCPADPTCQLVPNLPPMIPHRGRAHDCAIFGHIRTSSPRTPLAHLSLLTCPLSQTLSPSLSLCAHDQRAPPPPTVDCRPFCDRRRARAPSVASVSSALPSATRDTLWFALPLFSLPGLRSPERFLRNRSPTAVDPRLHHPPLFSKRPKVHTRGEHPSHAFISPSIAPKPAQLLTGVSCAATGLFPPRSVFSGKDRTVVFCTHSRVRRVTLNKPDPFPKPLEPRRGRPPRLRRALAVGPNGATALMSGPRPLDPGRLSEI
jgi:hypothetical protein